MLSYKYIHLTNYAKVLTTSTIYSPFPPAYTGSNYFHCAMLAYFAMIEKKPLPQDL